MSQLAPALGGAQLLALFTNEVWKRCPEGQIGPFVSEPRNPSTDKRKKKN